MNSHKLMLAAGSLLVMLGVAGCETKENHEKEFDSSANSVRGPNDFNEEAQKRDNREPQRLPIDPQREPNNPPTTQTDPTNAGNPVNPSGMGNK